MPPPPPKKAEFPVKVLSLTVTVAVPELSRPPPSLAEFPVKVLPLTVAVPELKMPPPSLAEFPVKVLPLTVNVPELSMPPPLPLPALPPAIVRPEIDAVTSVSTVNTLKPGDVAPRDTVSDDAPGPVIVTLAWSSSYAASVIVPVRPDWKRIVLPGAELAWSTAYGRLSGSVGSPLRSATVNVERSVRSSSRSSTGRCQRRPRRPASRVSAAGHDIRPVRPGTGRQSVNVPITHPLGEGAYVLRKGGEGRGRSRLSSRLAPPVRHPVHAARLFSYFGGTCVRLASTSGFCPVFSLIRNIHTG